MKSDQRVSGDIKLSTNSRIGSSGNSEKSSRKTYRYRIPSATSIFLISAIISFTPTIRIKSCTYFCSRSPLCSLAVSNPAFADAPMSAFITDALISTPADICLFVLFDPFDVLETATNPPIFSYSGVSILAMIASRPAKTSAADPLTRSLIRERKLCSTCALSSARISSMSVRKKRLYRRNFLI